MERGERDTGWISVLPLKPNKRQEKRNEALWCEQFTAKYVFVVSFVVRVSHRERERKRAK